MKPFKAISFFIAVLLAAGCAVEPAQTAETTASPKKETNVQTTVIETTIGKEASASAETEKSIPEIDGEELLAEYLKNTRNFREENMPPETENPTMAEQIYKTLYDFADFYDYRFNYMAFFVDRNDVISVERISMRNNRDLKDSPELFGRQDWEKYYRVTGGRITTGKEYFYQLCQCVSNHYLANGDRDGFETAFQLSDGNLYLTEYAIEGDPMAPASSVLEKISRIGEDRLLLEFTAVTKSLHPEIDEIVRTEQYTVTVCYEYDRWKVDECESRARELLCNEIIQGGTNQESPKTDLPEQIERCLKESGLM